ncbi:SPOR domain-containing protein [Leptospira sp. GIMC2001]|uniref:SPOR domain-containing protein n=1 Tax=Leptospira sp. GIMC2001 TaxID=1513297 RepID=UPI00234A2B3B|nr:SPOR domain-containing protein [Leptospira sp. GIMC2001]WCL50347.1 SPOR domain-containing protein [Leptospira sp. GIMC2001]
MLNIDYSRRLKTTGMYTQASPAVAPQQSILPKGRSPFPLFIGAILLFTGGMVTGLHLNQTEQNFQKTGEESISLRNTSPDKKIISEEKQNSSMGKIITDTSESRISSEESKAVLSDSSVSEKKQDPSITENSYYPKNLKFPPKMDQINYLIQIGAYEPAESARVGKLILKEAPQFQGRLFRTSTGKLFAGYFYKQDEAKDALKALRAFEKDDFTDADLKTVRF